MKRVLIFPLLLIVLAFPAFPQERGLVKTPPRVVGHRGLLFQAPENTRAAFAACLHLRFGFELDIRRTKDGVLVCLHDDGVERTTTASGPVAGMTLAQVRALDAGEKFGPEFKGERVPTLEEIFALVKELGITGALIALDFKIDDESVEGEVVALAKKHGILGQVLSIGRAITEPAVRKRLRAADPKTPVAVLASKAEDVKAALADPNADWIYLRFLPTRDQVAEMHRAGKKVFIAGVTVAGNVPDNWRRALEAGVDGLLTDYPLECQALYRSK